MGGANRVGPARIWGANRVGPARICWVLPSCCCYCREVPIAPPSVAPQIRAASCRCYCWEVPTVWPLRFVLLAAAATAGRCQSRWPSTNLRCQTDGQPFVPWRALMMRPLPLTFWIYMKICNLRGQDSLSLSLSLSLYRCIYIDR
jgi:hypothetical protein